MIALKEWICAIIGSTIQASDTLFRFLAKD
jgi:hypothetical protein